MYIYEGHRGTLYTTDKAQSHEDLYCNTCGDSDWLIGKANTRREAWDLLKEGTDINNSGGWDYGYVQRFLEQNFEKREER